MHEFLFSLWGPNILLDHLGTNFNVQGLKPELQREAGVVSWDMALYENLATSKCSQISMEHPPSIWNFLDHFRTGTAEVSIAVRMFPGG